MPHTPPRPTLRPPRYPYTTLFRSLAGETVYVKPAPLMPEDIQVENFVFDQEQRGSLGGTRSEEHTSELQSRGHIVCRILLLKQNKLMISKSVVNHTTYVIHAYYA